MILADINLLSEFLSSYHFNADVYIEDNGSVTMSLNEIDLVENGDDEKNALAKLAASILDYAEEYYKDFQFWSSGNRSSHKPYVFKALILNNVQKIGGLITCHHGRI